MSRNYEEKDNHNHIGYPLIYVFPDETQTSGFVSIGYMSSIKDPRVESSARKIFTLSNKQNPQRELDISKLLTEAENLEKGSERLL
jgi:hypothetical protein